LGTFLHSKLISKNYDFNTSLKRLVDWEYILRCTQEETPLFIDKITLLYEDSELFERISNTENYFIPYTQIVQQYSNLPMISIILISYNQEKYIRRAILSILSQYPEYKCEIIISDDASTDHTPQIINEYASKYPNLIKNISSRTHVGITENYRRCAKYVSGEYIAILEADDYWTYPRKLLDSLQFLNNNLECPMVFSRVYTEINSKRALLPSQGDLTAGKLTMRDFAKRNFNVIINLSACFFRRDFFVRTVSLEQHRISEIIFATIALESGKVGYISRPCSVYQISPEGYWSGMSKEEKLIDSFLIRRSAYLNASQNKEIIKQCIIKSFFRDNYTSTIIIQSGKNDIISEYDTANNKMRCFINNLKSIFKSFRKR